MRALIVGAGIGGLAAAVALRREGIDVTVIERAPALTEVGAGVVLGPHAMRALDHIGASGYVRDVNEAPERSVLADMISGETRVRTAFGEKGKQLYGEKLHTTHRRDLVHGLAENLAGARVHLNETVTAIAQDDRGVSVTTASGERMQGDFLVGADGLRSTVRTEILGHSEAVFTGYLAWRTVRPVALLGYALEPMIRLWMGSGRHIVTYPIRKGTQFYAAFYVPANEIRREDWSASGDVAELRASFADACPEVQALAAAIDEAFITGVYYREPLPTWRKGRVVLVGDAAHPVLPTSGSGAAVALEDAVAIAACLRRHGSDFDTAFGEFEARRKTRTSRLLLSSRADLTTYHESNPVKIAASGPINAGMRQLDPTGYQRLAWLYSYDEPAESAKSFDAFVEGTTLKPRRPEARAAFDRWSEATRLEDSIDGWLSERAAYERFLGDLLAPPAGVKVERIDCGGVSALKVVPPGGEAGPALFHLHGGGFVYGSAESAVPLAARLASALKGWALIPDYRLSPEHTALDMHADIRAAYDFLAAHAAPLAISGECAGAGLALGLMTGLRDRGERLPEAAYFLSPFVDMTLTAASIDANAAREPWLTRRRLVQLAGSYIQSLPPTDPRVSAIRAGLRGLPPMRIFAAQDEALVDDARALHSAAVAAGVDSRLTVVEDSVRSFALFESLPETARFFAEIGEHARSLFPHRNEVTP